MGGNSLTETIVFGRRAGEAAAAFSSECDIAVHPRRIVAEAVDELDELIGAGPELARPLQRALRDVMWERCGVMRDEPGLREGLARLDEIRAVVADVDVRPSAEGWSDLAQGIDLRPVCWSAKRPRGGAARTESRGCHNRADRPDLDPGLRVNFHTRLAADGRPAEPWAVGVEPVPAEASSRGWLPQVPPRRPVASSSDVTRVAAPGADDTAADDGVGVRDHLEEAVDVRRLEAGRETSPSRT